MVQSESPGRTGFVGRGLRLAARIAVTVVAVVLTAALAGAGYEAIASRSDWERHPAPGRLVDIGGYRLHLHCLGKGSPTVVFESGLGGYSLDWVLVQKPVSDFTRACAYDRSGLGWSDTGPLPRSPKQIAGELHRLLATAPIAPPYVLVGHSLGGKSVRVFTRDHPDEVAGMVLVDARNEYMDFHTTPAEVRRMADAARSETRLYRVAAVLGIPRLLGHVLAGEPELPADTADQMVLFATRARVMETALAENHDRADDDIELRDAPHLGNVPLVVLASGLNMARSADWRASQRLQAGLSRNSLFAVIAGSRHYIQWDRPAVVTAAIRDVVDAVRTHVPLSDAPPLPQPEASPISRRFAKKVPGS